MHMNQSTRSPEFARNLINELGGVNAVARLANVRPSSVVGWKTYGVPEGRLVRLAVIAERRGLKNRKELFPNDWPLIWPELS